MLNQFKWSWLEYFKSSIMNNPLVSIIVPVYNVENYLHKCVDSIVNQTYKSIEIILVDDESSDFSGQICDQYASIDSRIIVIHKTNEGVAQARLTGFNNSTGELIAFIDADDYVDLEYIEKLAAPFNEYDIDLCSCEEIAVYKYTQKHPIRTVHGLYSRNEIHKMLSTHYLYDPAIGHAGLPIYLCGKLIKKQYIEKALQQGLGLWWGEDQIALFYILINIDSMFALSDSLYYYIQHDGQATKMYKSSLWVNQFECWRRYKELDTECFLIDQLPIRMWRTSIKNFKIISKKIKKYETFKQEMKKIENKTTWKMIINKKHVAQGKREMLALFLLKHHLYYPFYKILLHRL